MLERVAGNELIKKLQQQGFSKWRIAKEINVSWQTVNLWAKGVFQPTQVHYEVLRRLVEAGALPGY